jgi:hypothetical protein
MTQTKHYNDLFQKQSLTNWDKLMDYYRTLRDEEKRWIFRGQADADWGLESPLERLARRFSINFNELSKMERGLVRKFQREASLYINAKPKKKDLMQWLALMQHHGTPMRLLDWTYSFFVAVYFAFETFRPQSRCAIWMIDYEWLRKMTKESVPDSVRYLIESDEDLKKFKTVNCLLKHSPPISTVCRLNPFHLNKRLVLQQGTFLAPGDVTRSFIDNLMVLSSSKTSRDHFVKLILDADLSFTKDAISELHRMNINRATLFPGLDGFATSLGNSVVIPEVVITYGLSME